MKKLLLILALLFTFALPGYAEIQVDGVTQDPPGGGGGGSQTPWTSNIDGGGFNLTNVDDITANIYKVDKVTTEPRTTYVDFKENGSTDGFAIKSVGAGVQNSYMLGIFADTSNAGSGSAQNPQGGINVYSGGFAFFINGNQCMTVDSSQWYEQCGMDFGTTANRWDKGWFDEIELTNGLIVGGTISGQGINPPIYFSALSLEFTNAGDSFPAPVKDAGTNIDINVLAFDASTDECAGKNFTIPINFSTSGTVTFKAVYYPATASTNSVYWDFKHLAVDNDESWDQALTTESDGGCAGINTQDDLVECEWTETVSNLGWAVGDTIEFEVCRDADNASDNLVGDANLVNFQVILP